MHACMFVFVIALFVAVAAGSCEAVHVSVARPVCVCMHACLCL